MRLRWHPAWLALGLSTGCLVDASKPCGLEYVLDDSGVCLLPADAALDPPDVASADVSIGDAGVIDASMPTGLGATCQSSADCAAYQATYCETFQSHTCLIQDCAANPSICPAGWGCCTSVTRYGLPTLCIPDGECPS
jgi:hypothetical protein